MQKASILPTSADLQPPVPWETESASRLSSALCRPGREREVTVGLQISFINHRTRVRENKVSRSHGSWAINQTSAA